MHRRRLLATVTGGLAGLAGCSSVLGGGGDSPCEGESCDIGMRRNAYVPEEYEVGVGDTVVWRNTSGANHTVTAYDDGLPEGAAYFASGGFEAESSAREAWADGLAGAIYPRETFEHTFEVAGTYTYLCIPHERSGMVGTVVVG